MLDLDRLGDRGLTQNATESGAQTHFLPRKAYIPVTFTLSICIES